MSDGSLFFTPSLRLSRLWHGTVSSGIFFCSHPFCRDTLMHRKWHGLFQVLAGAGTAAIVWSLLRHKSRKARRRAVRRRAEPDHLAIGEAQGEKQARSGAQVAVREAGSGLASQAQEQQQEQQQSASSTPERTPSDDRDVVVEEPEDGPLYQVTENALIVHQMLLQGDEEIQFRDFSALPVNGEPGGQHTAVDLANKVKAAAESAFFDQLGQGLSERPPQMERLVSLVLDSRDQLAALVPASTPEGQALMAGIKEKLDTEYVSQRISQGYDPAYLSQLFDFLVHLITRLQAPARRASTEAKYKAVQQQFAEAAAEAEAAAAAVARAAAAATAAAREQPAGDVPGSGGSAGGAPGGLRPGPGLAAATSASSRSSSFRERNSREWAPGAAGAAGSSFTGEDYRTVVLRPTASPEAKQQESEAEDSVTVQFVVREEVQSVRLIMRVVQKHWLERHGSMGGPAATPTPRLTPTGSLFGGSASNSRSSSPRPTSRAAGPASGGAAGAASAAAAAAALQRPSPLAVSSSASVAAPAEAPAASPAVAPPAATAAGGAAGRLARPLTVQVPGASSAAAAEQAAQQAEQAQQRPRSLSPGEVKALVAAAWLMWDQLRELKADVAKARLSLLKGAITHGGSGVQYERARYVKAIGDTPPALAMPKTLAWLRDAVLLGHPNPLLQGEELVRACVCTGILQLLQRPLAVSSADCPETLLLDCRTLVDLQNELQRVCLLVAACLITRQVLAGRQVRLPEEEQRELRAAIKRRIGVLLSAGVNLEGITVELNHQIQEALAAVSLPTSPDVSPDRAQLQQQQLAAAAAAAAAAAGAALEGEAAVSGDAACAAPAAAPAPASAGSAGGGSRRSVGSSAASAGDSDVEGIEVVARMVQRIFSTHDPVYQRVQAGIVSALTALLVGAQGLEGCRRVLRGIGGEIVLDEVLQLGAGVDKIGSLSAIVCLPFYEDLLKQIESERQAGAAGAAGSGSHCGSAHGQGQGTGTAPSVASSVGEGGGDGMGL